MFEEKTVLSFDGTELFFRSDIPSRPRAVVVIVHGMCEHHARYDYLAARLLAQGFAVYRFDHRGHGRSGGKRLYYSDFNEVTGDVDAIVSLAKSDFPDLPVFLLGHSWGGCAGALYGIRYPDRVRGIILSGAITFNNGGMGSAVAEQKLPPDAILMATADGLCSDPEDVRQWIEDPLVYKEITAALFYAVLAGAEHIRSNAAAFTDPVLIIHGSCDSLIAEKDSRDFFGAASSTDKGLIIYPNMQHEIFNEFKKDRVIRDVIAWLSERS